MDNFPHLLWIPAIKRPFIRDLPKGYIFGQAMHYNKVLSTTAQKFHNNFLVDIDLSNDREMFDVAGRLSPIGMSQFWRELNRAIRIREKEDAENTRDFWNRDTTAQDLTTQQDFQPKRQSTTELHAWPFDSNLHKYSLECSFRQFDRNMHLLSPCGSTRNCYWHF